MNTNRETAVSKESNMKMTSSDLIRWAGLAAMGAGLLFVFIQTIHPPEILSSVTTARWAIVHYLSIAMCLFGLLGMAGLYARQVEAVGWLGLTGYLLFSLFLALTLAFVFAEALIVPLLGTAAPKFVEGFVGIDSGHASEINLGALPMVYELVGVLYLLGGLLFGIATFRAGILSRWAAGLLAVGAISALPLGVLLPHEFQRLAAVPAGFGLAWLGYALWSERRVRAAEAVPATASSQLLQTAAE